MKLNLIAILAGAAVLLASCKGSSTSNTTTEGNWISRASLNGSARSFGVSFTIGDVAYVGTGRVQINTPVKMLNDFWKYDISSNSWKQIADFPGKGRQQAVAFSIGNKGYVGTGFDGTNYTVFSDFYAYNPATNSWSSRLASFPNGGRYWATGFAIGNKGYVTCGLAPDGGTYLKDMYSYDPAKDTWTQENGIPGDKRVGACAFVYNGKGYLVGGSQGGSIRNDFQYFDPTTGDWTELRKITNVNDSSFDDNYADITRTDGIALVMGSDVYFAVGVSSQGSSSPQQNTWHYDPATDLWDRRSAFEQAGRDGAVGFVIQNRGFVGTGSLGSSYYDDFNEFVPSQDLNLND